MRLPVLQVLGRSAGGIARHVADLTEALDGRDGIAIAVAAPPDLPVPMPGPVIPVVIPDGLFGHRRAIKALRAVVREGGYRVVHAHGLRAGIDAALASRDAGARVIVTVHNLVQAEIAGRVKAPLYLRAERLVVRLADKVLAVSRDIAQHLATSATDDAAVKIEVLHLGVDPSDISTRAATEVRAEIGLSADDRVVVTASRLSAQKALHVMLEAVARIDCHLVIMGQGPLEGELREKARALGLSDRVHFLGWRKDAGEIIAAGDVFCLSSIWEGVPLAALEAALIGTPIVATDVGGTGELVRDRVSGRLVPPRDPQALAAVLDEVLSDEHARRTYVDGARRVLDEEFDRTKMIDRVAALYREGSE